MLKFSQFKTRISDGNYRVNVSWDSIDDTLNRWQSENFGCHLEMNPDFQRGHVWTKEQQIAYIEFKLSGGSGSNIINFNCVGWMGDFKGPFVLVDGLQRLTAVLKFIHGELPAFGHFIDEFERLRMANADFVFCVNNLKTKAEVLQWYIEMNTGGTPHTEEEINKVKDLLVKNI